MATGKWYLPEMELTGDEMHVLLIALGHMAAKRRAEDPTTDPLSAQLYERVKARRIWRDDRDTNLHPKVR